MAYKTLSRISVNRVLPAVLALFAGLYLLSRYNYLLYHSLIELFAAAIALSVFAIGWNTYQMAEDTPLFLLAAAYLSVGVLDALHLLSYAGMGVFPERGSSLATQLWVAARFVESLSLLAAGLLIKTEKRINEKKILLFYVFLTILLVLVIIPLQLFPEMYRQGQGLTGIKVACEYIICGILAACAWTFFRQKKNFKRYNLNFLLAAIAATIISELSFTLYTDVYGFFNYLGHFFKLVSYWFIYKALVAGLLKDPLQTLFQNLALSRDELQESESSFRAVFENALQLMGIVSLDGSIVRANRQSLDMIGAVEQEVSGLPFWECPWWTHSEDLQEKLRKGIKKAGSGSPVRFEATHPSADGGRHLVDFSLSPIYDSSGNIRCLLAEAKDITESREKEEKLRSALSKLDKVIDLNLDGIIVMDRQGTILFINPASARMLGRPEEELEGSQFGTPLTSEETAEIELLTPEGNARVTEIRVAETEWDEKSSLLVSLRDITERKQAEEELRRSEEKYRGILESMEDGYFEVDLEGNFTFYNDAMYRILGYSSDELMNMNYRQYMSDETASEIFGFYNRLYRTGRYYRTFDWKLIRKDGSCCFVDASVSLKRDSEGRASGFRGIVRDVTERKKAEEEAEKLQAQLRQSQKMEAIGTLAGGIAHDFNNILSSVIGYTELSLEEAEEGSMLHSNLSQVLAAGGRARDLVKQILTLSRQEEQEFKPISAAPLVREALKMLRSTIPSSIEIREKIHGGQLVVNADPTQLHQVIVNLATNAKQAITDESGTIEICLEPASLDESIMKKYPDMKPGDYAKLAVRDTGEGIPEQHINKVFEPYFTTKEKGTGTGLGLSVVHGIVKKHNGHIQIYSSPGEGTVFNVYLPLAEQKSEAASCRETGPMPRGTEHILLVDDEQPIAEMQKQILQRLGYTVTLRTSGVEALEAFRAEPGKFDILISDMTMPNMTGDRLALEVKKLRRDFPVILCTGFSRKLDNPGMEEIDADDFLMKPVDKFEMAVKVRNALKGCAVSFSSA